jgi:transposase
MVRRGEITDRAWQEIEPLLPAYGQSGGQWRDHRTVINGILWKLRTGSPWRDLPERYGPWQTCFDRFNRWRRDGTWDRLLAHAQTKSDAVGDVEWEVSVDDTVIRGHQHAAGARSEPSAADEKGALEPRRRGPGTLQRGILHQGAPRLRRERQATVGGNHSWSAP